MSDSEAEIIISCMLIDEEEKKQKKKCKRLSARNIRKKIKEFGECHSLFSDSIENYVKIFPIFSYYPWKNFRLSLICLTRYKRRKYNIIILGKFALLWILLGFVEGRSVRSEAVNAPSLNVT
jgi:predicted ATP-binding protein involved in virulence